MTDTAAVTALRRYPVKSMLGEDLRTAALAEARFEGGPAVAVIERSAGNVATAERPRLWRGLLAFAGHWNQRSPRITLPDGTSIAADDPAAGEILSGLPGRDVHLSTVRPAGAGTEVTYTAEFAFKGAARYLAPLFRPALTRLGNQAEAGLRQALSRLA